MNTTVSTTSTTESSGSCGGEETYDPGNSTDEEKIEQILAHIWPTPMFWALIACHMVVFVVGLIGNALVCIAVVRNANMRTVTNIFIVNLAVADFLVLLFCLPATVATDVTQTWFFGSAGCKIISSLQWMSMAVSVLTLTFISLDRWYALCHPLRFHTTARWAKKAIALIWVLSFIIGSPYLVWNEAHAYWWTPAGSVYFTMCRPTWGERAELISTVFFAVCLYLLPLMFMCFTYCQIVRVLWRPSIPGQVTIRTGTISEGSRRLTSEVTASDGLTPDPVSAHIRSRRKAAKMLLTVVVMFAICLFFINLIMVTRALLGCRVKDVFPGIVVQVSTIVSHWLFYFNSAVNPIIYNFMSSNFRREFMLTSQCYSRAQLGSLRSGRVAGGRRRPRTVASGPNGRHTTWL